MNIILKFCSKECKEFQKNISLSYFHETMNHINIYSNLIKELENKSISLSKYVFITCDRVENMQCFIDYVNILNPDVYFIFVYII